MRPQKICVTFDWRGATLDAILKLASAADKLGFAYFWIPEAWGLECFSTAGYLLGHTEKIKMGCGIANVFSRSASLIGMACATLNQVPPEGRFVAGLGTSGMAVVEDFHGMIYTKPMGRLKDYAAVVKKVALGEPIDFEGETLRLSRFRLFTKPIDHVEVYLAALGQKSLRLAGQISDGAILTLYPKAKLIDADRAISLGGNPAVKLFAFYPLRTERSSKIIASNVFFYVSSMGKYYAQNLARLGFARDVETILNERARGRRTDEAYQIVSESLLDAISLSEDDIIKQIEQMPQRVSPVLALNISSPELLKDSITSLQLLASSM